MMQSFEMDFRILVGDKNRQWVSIGPLLGNAPALVDGYLRVENLRSSHFQGGFFIDVDGQPWSDDGTVDVFWLTMTWFHALKEILAGRYLAKASPWEESNLTLTRIGDELALEDVHFSGHISMPRVQVSLFEFAEKMIREGTKFSTLVNEIKREINSRRAAGVSGEIDAKLKEIERNLPEELEQEIQALSIRLRTSNH